MRITRVDILAFEFEMGMFPKMLDDAKAKGVDLAIKYIPREVFDKRAIERNQVQFHDVSYIEVKPHITPAGKNKPGAIVVELADYGVHYNQDIVENVAASLKASKSRLVVEQGNLVRISKDAKEVISREVVATKWTDWVDYWAVDFDFESKREIVRVENDAGEIEEVATGDFVFENEWQSFRIKKMRGLELKSVAYECAAGRRKIAVKVVDVFGNDTMKVIDVKV